MRGVLIDKTLVYRISKNSAKKPNSSRGCTKASSDNRLTPLLTCFLYGCSLPTRNIFNKLGDVSWFETLHTLLAG